MGRRGRVRKKEPNNGADVRSKKKRKNKGRKIEEREKGNKSPSLSLLCGHTKYTIFLCYSDPEPFGYIGCTLFVAMVSIYEHWSSVNKASQVRSTRASTSIWSVLSSHVHTGHLSQILISFITTDLIWLIYKYSRLVKRYHNKNLIVRRNSELWGIVWSQLLLVMTFLSFVMVVIFQVNHLPIHLDLHLHTTR